MKKNYILFICMSSVALFFTNAYAQCDGNRYHDYVFDSITVTSNIQYGSNLKSNNANQNLLLDVYQPFGDAFTQRPIVIIAHGGSFVGGSKTGTDVVPLCKSLAKMGYVTASIEYRVGMTNFPVPGPDSADAAAAVMRGTHDGRAAVRYFRKNARTGGNTYNIDTNNIYFAGVSAGGFIALHLAYLDQTSELLPYIDTTGVTVGSVTGQKGLHGGVEGASGNSGYSSKVKAIVNICGALADTAFMHSGDTPLFSFHGNNDATVPYNYSIITLLGFYPLIKIHGSSTVAMRANHQGIINCFETWEGQDHVPEVSSAIYYDSTITMTRNFLEHFTCGVALNCGYTTAPRNVVGINENGIEKTFSVYPNPANNMVTLDLNAFSNTLVNIDLYDGTGKNVKKYSASKTSFLIINRDNLPAGMYFIQLNANGKSFSKKILFE